MKKMALAVLCLCLYAHSGIVQVYDNMIKTGDSLYVTSKDTFVLMEKVFIDSGAVLKIGPGTVFKGAPGSAINATALIVARHGRLYAEGTREHPIIFTALADNVSNPYDIGYTERGLWGGVVILGCGRLNTTAGEEHIEGIDLNEPRGLYGGKNDYDNSGVLRYVSIRYPGADLGGGNELNGLTMGGVGRGTKIEYVEVFNSSDDGFEWFGGAVCCKYLVSAHSADDAFDYDIGWRGRGQYWLACLRNDQVAPGDYAGEHDGGNLPVDGQPYSIPVISNVTYIGNSIDFMEGTKLVYFRANAGGKYYNSIFTRFSMGIEIEQTSTANDHDSWERFLTGDLVLANNVFADVYQNSWLGEPASTQSIANGKKQLADSLIARKNVISTPDFVKKLTMFSFAQGDDPNHTPLDPRPRDYAVKDPGVIRGMFNDWDTVDSTGFIEKVAFKGAFNPFVADLWMMGWTALYQGGYLPQKIDTAAMDSSYIPSSCINPHLKVANRPILIKHINGQNTIQIEFVLHAQDNISVSLFDITGKKVAELINSSLNPGTYIINNKGKALSSGNYICVIRGKQHTISKKVLFIK